MWDQLNSTSVWLAKLPLWVALSNCNTNPFVLALCGALEMLVITCGTSLPDCRFEPYLRCPSTEPLAQFCPQSTLGATLHEETFPAELLEIYLFFAYTQGVWQWDGKAKSPVPSFRVRLVGR